MTSELMREILNDTAELVKQSAQSKRRTVALSPEMAEWWSTGLERIVTSRQDGPGGEVSSPVGDVAKELADLAVYVSGCRRCRLCEGRTQTVFSDGSGRSGLVFVGEAPGEQEDLQGIPFVGKAGQLLTDIIVKGMKLRRDDVYICNVLKCRPPDNRDPMPDEKAACEEYLLRQLELIRPKVLCALGKHAGNTLLKTDETAGKLRNRWHFYHGIPLRVTWHPAYLLRNPSAKKDTWQDVQEVLKVLSGEFVPEPPAGAAKFP